jgi:hypothetical protein
MAKWIDSPFTLFGLPVFRLVPFPFVVISGLIRLTIIATFVLAFDPSAFFAFGTGAFFALVADLSAFFAFSRRCGLTFILRGRRSLVALYRGGFFIRVVRLPALIVDGGLLILVFVLSRARSQRQAQTRQHNQPKPHKSSSYT